MLTLEKIIKLEAKNKSKIDPQMRKIFVGGLPHDVKIEVFRGYFETFGDIEDIVILQDKRTQKPRGFGFVTFARIVSVDSVMKNLDCHYIEDKWVDVKSAFSVEKMKQVLAQNKFLGKDLDENEELKFDYLEDSIQSSELKSTYL